MGRKKKTVDTQEVVHQPKLELNYILVITKGLKTNGEPYFEEFLFDSYNEAERAMHEVLQLNIGARGRIEYTYVEK